MKFSSICLLVPLFLAGGLVSLSAQQPSTNSDVFLSHVWFGDADLDAGGEMGSHHTSLRAGFSKSLGRGQSWGLSFDGTLRDYDFSGAVPLANFEPWDKVTELSLGGSWRKPVGDAGMLFIAPSISVARGDGADWEESLKFGAIFSYGYRFSKTLTIGFGAGIFTGLEETKAFPVLLVNWQINERWRVGNPFRPGPTGPAGIEVVYTINPTFELGLGGGWRSNRFRLDEEGVNPNGIGEVEGFPAFARLSWNLSEAVTVDFYTGFLMAGEITQEDQAGNQIYTDDLDPAPIGAITIQAAF